ncbi:hypothetical protein [Undibacterium sp.]|uniref:hypothetical protein n=1 Tax=Undibacterium sp. TaxID=1914977 RepID=UPI003752195B
MKSRLIELIDLVTSKHRRFKELEEITGVSADSWRMFYAGKQRATEEMIEKICQAFPKLALWITTGTSKPENEQYDAHTFVLMKKFHLSLILEKEPCEATEDEMVVIRAEDKRLGYINSNEDFAKYHFVALMRFMHIRSLGITRNEFTRREHESQNKFWTDNTKK